MAIQERILRRTPSVKLVSLKVFSLHMKQVMKKFPKLFSLSLENLEPKVKFLLERCDLSKAELGKVRCRLLCSYELFGTLP